MEYTFDFAVNAIILLILLYLGLMVYARYKKSVQRTLEISFWKRLAILVTMVAAFGAVASLYTLGMIYLQGPPLFFDMFLNRLLLTCRLELYMATAVSTLLFLLVAYRESTSHHRVAKRKVNSIREIKQKIESFYEELDQAIFIYLARKNGLEKNDGNFKDYRYFSNMKEDLSCKECLVNLYYALLLNRKYIHKLDDKLLALLAILRQRAEVTEGELGTQIQMAIVVFEQIEQKMGEIVAFFKQHTSDLSVVNDAQMPHFYVEGDADLSMDALTMFEALSIVILDNKYVTDHLLDMLTEAMNRHRQY